MASLDLIERKYLLAAVRLQTDGFIVGIDEHFPYISPIVKIMVENAIIILIEVTCVGLEDFDIAIINRRNVGKKQRRDQEENHAERRPQHQWD